MIHIRKGTVADLDAIMACYDAAKRYMRQNGNHNQWINGYPSRELVTDDIASGISYVGVDDHGDVAMAFVFIIGQDPTYAVIEDGQWPDSLPYGTIHRLGSNGRHHGILRICVDFCMGAIDNIRLDTHADNITMQRCREARLQALRHNSLRRRLPAHRLPKKPIFQTNNCARGSCN